MALADLVDHVLDGSVGFGKRTVPSAAQRAHFWQYPSDVTNVKVGDP